MMALLFVGRCISQPRNGDITLSPAVRPVAASRQARDADSLSSRDSISVPAALAAGRGRNVRPLALR